MAFEEKKFCRISTLMERWDCSRTQIYDLISRGRLKRWHPEGQADKKGTRICVSSILQLEETGYV